MLYWLSDLTDGGDFFNLFRYITFRAGGAFFTALIIGFVFGQPLINNQVIHFRLAELQTEIECLRALVYQATEQYVAGKDVTQLASMAKLKAGRLGREVTDACLQYWGGMGYMWDNPVARAYRDVRLVSIGGGADEIMLGIICKLMGTLPGKRPAKSSADGASA